MKAKVVNKNRIISKKGDELFILRVLLLEKLEIVSVFVSEDVFNKYDEGRECEVKESIFYRNERGFCKHVIE